MYMHMFLAEPGRKGWFMEKFNINIVTVMGWGGDHQIIFSFHYEFFPVPYIGNPLIFLDKKYKSYSVFYEL